MKQSKPKPRRRWLFLGCLLGLALLLFALNSAPSVSPISPADPSTHNRPYVVKLHARWCPLCVMTKGKWAKVQEAYTGRVNLVVFDFTSSQTKAASRAEARRLGLEAFFDEHSNEPGSVYILDGATREVKDFVPGVQSLSAYTTAIDGVLKSNGP